MIETETIIRFMFYWIGMAAGYWLCKQLNNSRMPMEAMTPKPAMKKLFDDRQFAKSFEFACSEGTSQDDVAEFIQSEIKRNVREALKQLNTIYELYDDGDQIEIQEFRKDIDRVLKLYE